jgi:ubiquitin carboxyl-terminal hydrolase MINDY-1/2
MFRPAMTGGELALFASADITLVHGWLVDPDSPEYVARVKDSATNLIIEVDVLTRGLLVGNSAENDGDGAGPSHFEPSDPSVILADEERQNVEDGELPVPDVAPASLIRKLQPLR